MKMHDLIPNICIHRIEVAKLKDDDDERCRTFVLHNEDHTLGNSLRYIIMKDPDVDYCGYSVPHPSEHKINLRIQTRTKPAMDILEKALGQLQKVCDHVLDTFKCSVKEFKNNRSTGDEEMESDDDYDEDDD